MPPITLVATHTAKKGCREKMLKALHTNMTASRLEKGNLQFDVYEKEDEVGIFVLLECWTSPESVTAHRNSAHFLAYMEEAATFLEHRTAQALHKIEV